MTPAGRPPLVLIVEDDDRNLKLTRDVLQFHGVRTIEAMSGEEGVALAREHIPDLILMDIALPGIDGVTATRHLKDDPATASIPIVALTASVMTAERARIDGAGFDGCMTKPIDVPTFAADVLMYCSPGSGTP